MKNPIQVIKKVIAESAHPRRSDQWPEFRSAWLKTHPTCAACGSNKDLEVHHKKPFHLFPAMELDMKNYITLCETIGREHHLHVGHSFAGKTNWKTFNPHVVKDAAAMLEDHGQ